MKHLTALLLVATVLITSAAAQTPDWTEITPANSPSARLNHAMAYDSTRGKVVLFGGYDGSGRVNDTWEYDGVNWALVTTASSPSDRGAHAMVYDSVRGKVVMFGGTNGGYLNDTLEYDGVNWTQVTIASSPSARDYHAMVYDDLLQNPLIVPVSRGHLFYPPVVTAQLMWARAGQGAAPTGGGRGGQRRRLRIPPGAGAPPCHSPRRPPRCHVFEHYGTHVPPQRCWQPTH